MAMQIRGNASNICKQVILSFMSTRCDVSSQHKLPTKDEITNSATFKMLFSDELVDRCIDELIDDNELIVYGCYISDRTIEVL